MLILLVALPYLASILAALLPSNARNAEAWLAGFVALCTLGITAWLYPQVANGGVVREEVSWLPAAGLNLIFRLDGFAWLFCLLVTGVGFLVVLYARYYMSPADPVPGSSRSCSRSWALCSAWWSRETSFSWWCSGS